MKLAMFKEKEDLLQYLEGEREMVKKNLARVRREYKNALEIDIEELPTSLTKKDWEDHLKFKKDSEKYWERRLRKVEREIAELI